MDIYCGEFVSMRLTPIKDKGNFYVSQVEGRKVYLKHDGDLTTDRAVNATLHRHKYKSEVGVTEVFDFGFDLKVTATEDKPALVSVTIRDPFPLWNSRKCATSGCALEGNWLH